MEDTLLTARPQSEAGDAGPTGRRQLAHGAELYVPDRDSARPPGLLLLLHAAHRRPADALGLFEPLADASGLVLLAPKSERETWDRVYGGFGADVRAIDELLAEAFTGYAIDAERVFAAGFSDGASYALSLGLMNGDLFTAIVALSPGFAAPAGVRGRPRVFVSHGRDDPVFPPERTSLPIVARLRAEGYDVTHREIAGAHSVPEALVREAVGWLG